MAGSVLAKACTPVGGMTVCGAGSCVLAVTSGTGTGSTPSSFGCSCWAVTASGLVGCIVLVGRTLVVGVAGPEPRAGVALPSLAGAATQGSCETRGPWLLSGEELVVVRARGPFIAHPKFKSQQTVAWSLP